jgi:DNA invertase Pin-like site-specific DNA recombinase
MHAESTLAPLSGGIAVERTNAVGSSLSGKGGGGELAVGYVRVSTAMQAEEGHSIEAQVARIRGYAALRGLHLVEVVVDAGVSGTVPLDRRPGGVQVLKALYPSTRTTVRRVRRRVDQVRHLIGCKLDRFFRNAADSVVHVDRLERDGVAMHFVDQGIDTSTATGRMFIQILSACAEFEAEQASLRTTEVRSHMRQKGVDCGGKPPFGYRRDIYLDPETQERRSRFVPVLEEQRAIMHAKSLREAGCTLWEVVHALNADARRYPPRGKKWHLGSVQALLRAGDLTLQERRLLGFDADRDA